MRLLMDNNSPVWAIIPAAGTGTRMQTDIPKQYIRFQDKTIIEHCLDRLLSHAAISGAVIVLRQGDDDWNQLEYRHDKPVFTAIGGDERNKSVYNGLIYLQSQIGNSALAMVHDAVRPLVTHRDLARVIDAARQNSVGAILASPVIDSLKIQNHNMEIAGTQPREGLWRALTPQVFDLQQLLRASKRVIDEDLAVTDDAQAVELAGFTPTLVEGSATNLKITTPADLSLAEKIWLDQRDQQDDE
jgi:2-C-methyl-D-erythritol 4-phosphate cytidylyltransferase